jgi:hypothetical protein
MKQVLSVLFVLLVHTAMAQYGERSANTFTLGAGYTTDYPGLRGYTILGEVSRELTQRFEVAVGVKLINATGSPRTPAIPEFTRAKTIDFNAYYLPVNTETSRVKVGLGYAFSFYHYRKAFPVINEVTKETEWTPSESKGRRKSLSLIGQYEYLFPNSNFSVGARAAIYVAQDILYFAGPTVAMRF